MGIKQIPGLNRIEHDADGVLTIGATALLAEVVEHPHLRAAYPMLARAAGHTATVQIRNMGTVMGNLCNASPSADNIPTLLAMGATIVAWSPAGEREIPLDTFFLGPGRTALEATEIAVAIRVPQPPAGHGASYQKISRRSKVDIAAVNIGAFLTTNTDGTCAGARICMGAVGPTPLRATAAEAFLQGKEITAAVAEEAGYLAGKQAAPISDVRASKEYRRLMVTVLTKRALLEAWDTATAGR
jgi:carbon-monoxide dehydrogenase medium subunit